MIVFTGALGQDTVQQIIPGRTNSITQQQKPYVILISSDGFRADMAEKYQAQNLLRFKQQGVSAPYMLPSFPSLTFPNHYSIVTGLYPAHHGLVDNSFYDTSRRARYSMSNKNAVGDSSWYAGTPLWVLAEKQQMLSASFYWVASEAAIQGVRPTYYYTYNEKIDIDTRVEILKDWLQLPEDKRPHFITFYLPEPDHVEHSFGPESVQAKEAVLGVDSAIGKLVKAVDALKLPVNYIFLSDHGMTTVDTINTIPFPKAIDTTKFYVPNGDVLVHLYAKDRTSILPTYHALKQEAVDYDVYLAENIPSRWHYSRSNDRFNRVGDMIMIPKHPRVFRFGTNRVTPGKHGLDPAFKDMHATFIAWGPAFKNGKTVKPFENVNVYPLITEILGLQYDPSTIDGKLKPVKRMLK
ncbi:ectonucleotide pyrophosphatase/phosphodiesterase [Segetibacter sp. 3557_3]|uniref:alkaline phosphatase family protein n=1 Tax=Segetibacter sp. 3557_3 TaxID=2547429 RepID=UPI001FB73EE9|nr:ectonucleotide pyrophosphatase/phosphodiesterase [Segetibacter sp. 3557_3]